jgi:hypothetical protein
MVEHMRPALVRGTRTGLVGLCNVVAVTLNIFQQCQGAAISLVHISNGYIIGGPKARLSLKNLELFSSLSVQA